MSEQQDQERRSLSIKETVTSEATRLGAKKAVAKIGMAKIAGALAVIALIGIFFLSVFGAAYMAAQACVSKDEAALGAPGGGVTVGASVFGGPQDPGTGHGGYRGDDLRKKWDSYAELSSNPNAGYSNLDYRALGVAFGTGKELPYRTALRVTTKKGSLVLKKRDRGGGGGYVEGKIRAIDLWYTAAAKLGMGPLDTALVKVEPVDGSEVESSADVAFTDSNADNSDKMVRPTSGPFTSPFGMRWGRLHAGVDIAPPMGTPIVSVLAGRVVFAGTMSGYGNYICVRHNPKLSTCYGHQQRFARGIREGVLVTRGQRIGYVGNTGFSTGPHLHFEVRLGPGFSGTPTDPKPYLSGATEVSSEEQPAAGDGGQCVQPDQVNAATAGNYAWPIGNAKAGSNIIGRPGQGTHSFTAPPNNWQSDNGIDIGAKVGEPVLAVDNGQISPTMGFGNLTGDAGSRFAGIRLHLVDASKNTWYYAHLSRVKVKPGDNVTRGQVIGYSGSANGVGHLHLAVEKGNPLTLLGVK